MPKISDIKAREILDSRGNPTVQATVFLDDGIMGESAVPSGASKGTHEAVELRDGDEKRYNGMGVLKAIDNIEKIIAPKLKGFDACEQLKIDNFLIDLDGTADKSKLGANSILPVSLSVCRAAAYSLGVHLFQYIAGFSGKAISKVLPDPMFNIINGGLHGSGSFNFQEFMIIPSLKFAFPDALMMGVEFYHLLKKLLIKKGLTTCVGDEGGFSPNIETNREVLLLIREVIDSSKYQFVRDVNLGLDLAASTFYRDNSYETDKGKKSFTPLQYIAYLKDLDKEFNFIFLEDPLPEDDWGNWQEVTKDFAKTKMIVGDDLLVTNIKRLEKAIELKACNSILVKVNQIGTLSETLEVIKRAKQANFKIIISHRSGETNDDFISDLAVGTGADFVKFGAPARGERVAKYNRLLEIYSQLN